MYRDYDLASGITDYEEVDTCTDGYIKVLVCFGLHVHEGASDYTTGGGR